MSASESDARDEEVGPPPLAQRRRRVDLEVQADAVDQAAPVLLGLQVVVDDPRARVRDRRAQRDLAAARRLHDGGAERVGVVERHAEELLVEQHPAHVELDVGRREAVARADERAALAAVGGDRPAALGLVRANASGVADEIRLPLSVKTTNDSIRWSWRFWPTGRSWRHSIPNGANMSAGPTPERCRSCGEWYVPAERITSRSARIVSSAAAARDLDADRARAVEQDPVDAGVREHLDVAARDGGTEVGDRRRAAAAVALGDLEAPGALLGGAVEVVVARDADLLAGVDERLDDRVHRPALAHAQRPADAVVAVRAALVVLGAPEVRQDVLVGPAVVAQRRPLVVVGRVAADVDHRVERARAAEDAAARQVVAAEVEPRLGLGEQRPVEVARQVQPEAERHVDVRVVVGRPGLDHGDAHVRVLAQAVGHDAAGRSCAHDHVVMH